MLLVVIFGWKEAVHKNGKSKIFELSYDSNRIENKKIGNFI